LLWRFSAVAEPCRVRQGLPEGSYRGIERVKLTTPGVGALTFGKPTVSGIVVESQGWV